VEKMGKREGIGDVLADGVRMAAAKLDKNSEQFAQHIKGLEVTGYDLRCLKTAALSFAVSFRGADHTRSSAYALDLKGKVDRLKAERGRGKLVKELEDIYSLIDSFIVCKNAKATFYMELAELSKLYTLVTGNELAVEDLSASAERINTLARLINMREGLSRKDDTLPWKVLNVPIPDDGPAKGAIVTQEELDLMLDDYYDARGWNLEGVPKVETLNRLGMEEFVGLTESKEA